MTTDFSTAAFLAELDSFGKPPPPKSLVCEAPPIYDAKEITTKLNAINMDKQRKIRGSPPSNKIAPTKNTTSGMVSLASKMGTQTKEEISRQEAENWRDMVISANRPKNPWYEQQRDSPDASREYARSIAKSTGDFDRHSQNSEDGSSRSSTANGSLPSPPGNSGYSAKYSDYSSASSLKSSSPPSTLKPDYNPSTTPNYKSDYKVQTSGYTSPLTSSGYSYKQNNAIPSSPASRPSFPPTIGITREPDYTPGYTPSELAYQGVKNQGMVGTTYSYGITQQQHPEMKKHVEFPKVDILNTPPTRYTSSPSTSDYGSERNNRSPKDNYNKFVVNGKQEEVYGSQSKIPNGPIGNGASPRPTPSSDTRANKWMDINRELTRQDEQFGRLTQQISEEMDREQRSRVKTGNCKSCLDPLYTYDDITIAMDRKYHAKCFNCEICGRSLREQKFYVFDDKFMCQEDFLHAELHKNAEKCAQCKQPIVEMVLQALDKSFHPHCFKCVVCSKSLDGVAFAVDNKDQVYCMPDYYEKFSPRCAACQRSIIPKEGTRETVRVVALNKDFHVECYICEGCGCQLTDESNQRCYPLDDHLLCLKCHKLWKNTGGAATTDL